MHIKNNLLDSKLESVDCNICNSKDGIIICKKGKFSHNVINLMCSRCALIFVSPRWTEDCIKKYYKCNYYFDYINNYDINELLEKRQLKDGKRIEFLLKNINLQENSNILEIGSSFGTFLYKMSQMGHKVKGIEPSIMQSKISKERFNIEIIENLVEEVDKAHEKFHLIAMFHVFEHLRNPSNFLLKFREHIYDNGFLYIEAPSILREPGIKPKEDFFRAVHFYTFTPLTLNILLKKCGYEVKCRDENYNNIRIIAEKMPKIDFFLPPEEEIEKEKKKILKSLRFWNIKAKYNKTKLILKRKLRKILKI